MGSVIFLGFEKNLTQKREGTMAQREEISSIVLFRILGVFAPLRGILSLQIHHEISLCRFVG